MRDVHHVLTWDEFLDRLEPEASLEMGALQRTRTKSNGLVWYGGWSFKKTLQRARGEGYSEALPEVEQLVSHVEKTVDTDRHISTFESRFDVAGAEVDMGRFLSGEPECMVESSPIRIARKGRCVRIVVPVAYSAFTDPAVVRARGAAIVALCDILARAQHPLEVWAVLACSGDAGKSRYVPAVLVQAADQPLDMGRIMLALAHPSMFRRLGFSFGEHESVEVRQHFGYHERGGYGYPSWEAKASDLPPADGETIVLPWLSGQGENDKWSKAQSVKWIEQQLDLLFGEEVV